MIKADRGALSKLAIHDAGRHPSNALQKDALLKGKPELFESCEDPDLALETLLLAVRWGRIHRPVSSLSCVATGSSKP